MIYHKHSLSKNPCEIEKYFECLNTVDAFWAIWYTLLWPQFVLISSKFAHSSFAFPFFLCSIGFRLLRISAWPIFSCFSFPGFQLLSRPLIITSFASGYQLCFISMSLWLLMQSKLALVLFDFFYFPPKHIQFSHLFRLFVFHSFIFLFLLTLLFLFNCLFQSIPSGLFGYFHFLYFPQLLQESLLLPTKHLPKQEISVSNLWPCVFGPVVPSIYLPLIKWIFAFVPYGLAHSAF